MLDKKRFFKSINKINGIINRNTFNARINFAGFFYNTIFLLVILQSIFVQISLVSYNENISLLIFSEVLVLLFFLFDYFITFYYHVYKYSNQGFFKKYILINLYPLSIIQIFSIIISIFYIAVAVINIDFIISSASLLLFLNIFQCIRLIIIFRYTKFTKLFCNVFKRQYNLILGWFIYMVIIILLFGFIFYIFVKPTYNLWQSIYYSVIVITTIGIGDIHPPDTDIYSQVVTIIFGFIGGASYALLASIIFSGLVLELKNDDNTKNITQINKKITKIKEETEAIAEKISHESKSIKDIKKTLEISNTKKSKKHFFSKSKK